ncbi:MAG TPA: response regulator [Candidatus Udaeobacter sp.]|jgi:CheY-like chemotaxis protein|nr:response regulator [Candidatus Udaeobacter sp.]
MRHILVVEDDPHNAILFKKLLERRGGYQVSVTESGDEIVRLVTEGTVELVIMDVSLANTRYQKERMSGVEMCQLLKKLPATSGTPVLLATAHAMRGDAESLMNESGADDYVAKPILDHDAFMQQVRSMLKEAA